MSDDDVLTIHGPRDAPTALVLDSPHSGRRMPADFGAACSEAELRDGEDCFIDELYAEAAASGVPLLAAQFPRTYIDPNRHAADIDPELLAEPWPEPLVPSGKAALGKALVWRTLDDGRPIYARRLGVAEVRRRIERYHRPYHQALVALLEAAHARHGVVWHLNCHSMNPVAGVMGEGGAGATRADIVLGDRDGTTCSPAFTAFVREVLEGWGLQVKVNDPYKGVELVRAYSAPAAGRHSLQLEINKRLYMDAAGLQRHAGFALLRERLGLLVQRVAAQFTPGPRHG